MRSLDGSRAASRGEALHFDDVAALILQRGGHIIESGLGVLAQNGLAGAEANLGLVSRFVLVDIADHLLHRGQTGVGLSRGLLRGLSFVTGIDGVLVSLVCLG